MKKHQRNIFKSINWKSSYFIDKPGIYIRTDLKYITIVNCRFKWAKTIFVEGIDQLTGYWEPDTIWNVFKSLYRWRRCRLPQQQVIKDSIKTKLKNQYTIPSLNEGKLKNILLRSHVNNNFSKWWNRNEILQSSFFFSINYVHMMEK